MDSFPIIRVVTKLIIPYILLFGFYVQFHGDFGPGGGFQAGVILASALILYGLVFGLPAVKTVMPPKRIEKLIALGVLIYAGTGVATMLIGQPASGGPIDHHAVHVGHDDDHDQEAHEHLGDTFDNKDKHDRLNHDVGEMKLATDGVVTRTHANFLDYDALDHHFLPGILPHGQHLGIFVIELGVGITVTAVMTMIFYCFAGRQSPTNAALVENRQGENRRTEDNRRGHPKSDSNLKSNGTRTSRETDV